MPSSVTDQRSGTTRRPLGRFELTCFLAIAMALVALGTDVLLPAFGAIRRDLGLLQNPTAVAGILTTYFLGLGLGQLVYGPLSDRYGRKPALVSGLVVYVVGALLSALAGNLGVALVARFVWGFGASGPRVISAAVIRDLYEGEEMARAMSLIMAVFILVPVIAPAFGAVVTAIVGWRWLIIVCAGIGALVLWWSHRLHETLPPERRRPLTPRHIAHGARAVASNRVTALYTLAIAAQYGTFLSYLGSSELIVTETLGRRDLFPLIFGVLAALMGIAMLANASVVRRLGMRVVAHGVLVAALVAGTVMVSVAIATDGRPPLWLYLAVVAPMVICHSLLIPNLNAIAMLPMGALAGTASAVIGAVQLAIGSLLARFVDRSFDGGILPLSVGFLAFTAVALLFVAWAERGRLFAPPGSPPGSPPGRSPVGAETTPPTVEPEIA